MKHILNYFKTKELIRFRLVCQKWRDLISQIPISFHRLKFETKNSEKISTLFNINSFAIFEDSTRLHSFLKNCKKISKLKIHNYFYDINSIPNPELLKCIHGHRIAGSAYEKFPNLEELK
jgi:hypothetical protein